MSNDKKEKTGGRSKGTPNRITRELRKDLKSILESEINQIPELLSQIKNPERKLNFILKLMPYVLPKMKTIYHTEGESPILDFNTCTGFEY